MLECRKPHMSNYVKKHHASNVGLIFNVVENRKDEIRARMTHRSSKSYSLCEQVLYAMGTTLVDKSKLTILIIPDDLGFCAFPPKRFDILCN